MTQLNQKEKALQLANKFVEKSVFDMTNEELIKERIKAVNMAIIAVEEIINDNPNIYDSDRLNYKYWHSVKDELIKLKQ